MVRKDTQRKSDRKKLIRHKTTIEDHFKMNFNSLPFCNRCKINLDLKQLEVNHINYDEFWRFAELVCHSCHENIDTFKILPKFEEIKDILPQTIVAFQKTLSGIVVVSRLTNNKLILSSRIKLRKSESVNPRLPLNFI